MRRSACGGCGSPDLEVFLNLGATPLADAFPEMPDVEEQRYPLEIAVCPHCWLVQLMEVVPDDILFGADYAFHSSGSPSLVQQQREAAAAALSFHGRERTRFVVEVGCNDGSLLEHFARAGSRVVGVDPAGPPAALARGRGIEVLNESFGMAAAEKISSSHGTPGLIIANHVVAHAADLDDMMAGFARLLDPDGTLSIEVQYLPDLLAGTQFDHVYHEHRSYFSLTSLKGLLERHGLKPCWVEHLPRQGGALRLMARHSYSYRAGDPALAAMIASERRAGIESLATYHAMRPRVSYVRDRLVEMVCEARRDGPVAGYGATAKSCTLLHHCGIGREHLDCVLDLTPWKIGRYTPGTHIPVISPPSVVDPAETYLLLAWNYLSDILRREWEGAGNRFIVPLPLPVML